MTTYYQKKAITKYHKTPKGQEALRKAQRKYAQSKKGKARAENYAKSQKGQNTMRACKQKIKTLKQYNHRLQTI